MAYIGVSPSNGVRRVHTYSATASQTTFSGAGAEGTSLSYKDSNFVDVYQNGVKLGDADYTATSGTSIVLGTGASASDLVVIVVFDVFSVADTVSKADGGTFDGNVTMAGTLTGTTATFSTADNNPQLTLVSTDADENVGPEIDLYRNSASPADGDILGRLVFNGENDADEKIDYANIQFRIADASDGTEDAKLLIVKKTAGADVSVMASDATETVFNDGSVDLDFRVESNNNANMLFVDGADDRVGIGTSTFGAASHKLEVDGGSGETRLRISSTGTDQREAGIILANSSKSSDNDGIVIAHGGAVTTFDDLGGNELMRISQTSNHAQLLIGVTDTTPFSAGAPGQVIALNDGVRYGAIFGCDNTANRHAVVFVNPNGEVGSIKTNGTATSYNTSSDYRLKENVNYSFDATARLKQLKPCRFNFIADANTTLDGFLAHEVSDIVPEAISGEKDAIHVWKDGEELPSGVSVGDKKVDANGKDLINSQSIDQSKLVPLLVKTLQEALTRIDTLEAEVKALKG